MTQIPSADLVVTDIPDADRFTLTRGEELLAVLDYADDGRTISLTRAFTIPTYRGQGLAARVVEGAVEQIAARGDRRVRPVCWYVAEWFDAHPEQAHLLADR